MKVVGRPKLTAFVVAHSDSKVPLQCWLAEVEGATWQSIDEVCDHYPEARRLGDSEVQFVFEEGGCAVRVAFIFSMKFIFVRRVSALVEDHV